MIIAITDRRQMIAPDVLARANWREIAELFAAAIAKAHPAIVQVRERDLDGGPLLLLVRAAMGTGAKVMVNDRVDVALAAGAYGVHLPERGMAIDDVRALAPALAIGVSRHSIDGVKAATGADFIQLGPIWRSPGKGEPLGPLALEGARGVIPSTSPAKLVAVGGIETAERVRVAERSGADAVAAIRAVWSGKL